MREKYRVGILGATGMVGQQLIRVLRDHPWLELVRVAASESSAGKSYEESVTGRWFMDFPIPESIATIPVQRVEDVEEVSRDVDIVFSAISASKEEVKRIEHMYASAGVWVSSCNSAFRSDPLVPMMIPAANPFHLDVIQKQREVNNYGDGAIIVKSNCSIQSYVIALQPLLDFGLQHIIVHSDQAISGAGKTFETWPEMANNLIPYIAGEEEKSEKEPLKIWGEVTDEGIVPAKSPRIRAKCVRVAVDDGHTAFVIATFEKKPTFEEILDRWQKFSPCEGLPSAPKQFIHYLSDPERPQPKLDVWTENGMAISIGQLRVDDYGVSFTALSHNTILGAAGGALLATELAIKKGYIKQKTAALSAEMV